MPKPSANASDTTAAITPSTPADTTETTNPTPRPAPQGLSVAQCACELAQRFPALFGPQATPGPVKLRIHVDILERAPQVFTRRVLAAFLSRHTTTTPYLKALVGATHRLDLDGAPAGEILEEHRQAAVQELARRRQQHQAHRRPNDRPGPAERRKPIAQRGHPRERGAAAEDAQLAQRRERAELLRAFESTTLTLANFCALKGLDAALLEATLTQARAERQAAPATRQYLPREGRSSR